MGQSASGKPGASLDKKRRSRNAMTCSHAAPRATILMACQGCLVDRFEETAILERRHPWWPALGARAIAYERDEWAVNPAGGHRRGGDCRGGELRGGELRLSELRVSASALQPRPFSLSASSVRRSGAPPK